MNLQAIGKSSLRYYVVTAQTMIEDFNPLFKEFISLFYNQLQNNLHTMITLYICVKKDMFVLTPGC
jgi:hypothetical protein